MPWFAIEQRLSDNPMYRQFLSSRLRFNKIYFEIGQLSKLRISNGIFASGARLLRTALSSDFLRHRYCDRPNFSATQSTGVWGQSM